MVSSLVTGGAGFIGSHVAKYCQEAGHQVVVLDDLSGGFEDQVPEGVEFVSGSVTDAALVERIFRRYDFNYVYHLAAYAAEGLSHFIRRFNYENNLIGTVNLINQSVKCDVERFVFTSSIAVYGSNQVPMSEETVPNPEDPYGVAKYAVELDLRCAFELFGLKYTIFRPHNVYGENQNIGDRYRNVIGIFMNQIMQSKPMTIFGDGSQTRAFSYISDVAPNIAKCVEIPETANQVINIGADRPYSVRELAETVARVFDVEPIFEFLQARNEVVHAYADHEKAISLFGAQDPVGLVQGVSEMAAWAKNVGARRGESFSGIEIDRNMPEGWKRAFR